MKLLDWYFSSKTVPQWGILIIDLLICAFSVFAAFTLAHGPEVCAAAAYDLTVLAAFICICCAVFFKVFGTNQGLIRKTGFNDLVSVNVALACACCVVAAVDLIIHPNFYPRFFRISDLILFLFIAGQLMMAFRVISKKTYDYYATRSSHGGVYGLSGNALLDMEMNELLPRDPIDVDMNAVVDSLKDKVVMVTGAAGSIGSELSWLIANCAPKRLVLIDQAETPLHDVRMRMREEWPDVKCTTIVTSICHSKRMDVIFRRFKPQVIFNAAAYKHVPMMEDNPVESVLNNVDGTRKLADLAVKYKAERFIQISTDKAVNPTNVMGCSKRICEIYCQSLAESGVTDCKFITTRFGNVLGSNGSVIPIFREQIRKGGPVKVTHPDINRFFMLIPEACRLVLEAARTGETGQILVFDMGKPVKIVDLAKRMILLSGRSDIKIKFTGLRPGEKLYEEVLNDKENVLPTSNAKIKIAKVRKIDFQEAREEVTRLVEAAKTYDSSYTVALMRRIVPEYVTPLAASRPPKGRVFRENAAKAILVAFFSSLSLLASAVTAAESDTLDFRMKTERRVPLDYTGRSAARDTLAMDAVEHAPISGDTLIWTLAATRGLFRPDWFLYVRGACNSFQGDRSRIAAFSGTLSPELSLGLGRRFNPWLGAGVEFTRSKSRGYTTHVTDFGFGYGPFLTSSSGEVYRRMRVSWWNLSAFLTFDMTRLFTGYEGYLSRRNLNTVLFNGGIGLLHQLNYDQIYGNGWLTSGFLELMYRRYFTPVRRLSIDVAFRWLMTGTNFDFEHRRQDRLLRRVDSDFSLSLGLNLYLFPRRASSTPLRLLSPYRTDF